MKTAEQVAEDNDDFRSGFARGNGKISLSLGVQALNLEKQVELLGKVRAYNKFNADNDPYGEHDFGSVNLDGDLYFWKIDYYNPDMCTFCDPYVEENQPVRVLTLMLSSEY